MSQTRPVCHTHCTKVGPQINPQQWQATRRFPSRSYSEETNTHHHRSITKPPIRRHAVHPATVHFPIAFLGLSYTLDVGYKYAPVIFKSVPGLNLLPLATVPATSYFLLSIGLLTAVPAIATGVPELLGMIARQDLAKKLSNSPNKLDVLAKMHPKLKIAFMHALINDIAILGSAYSWYLRRGVTGYVPSDAQALGSLACLIGVFGSAALGGMLVYDYGVGVVPANKSAGKAE